MGPQRITRALHRASNAERSLQEKEAVIVERDHHVADLQRQLSDALARQHSAGVPAAMPPPQVNLERPGVCKLFAGGPQLVIMFLDLAYAGLKGTHHCSLP